jgi:hypothetical protein
MGQSCELQERKLQVNNLCHACGCHIIPTRLWLTRPRYWAGSSRTGREWRAC